MDQARKQGGGGGRNNTRLEGGGARKVGHILQHQTQKAKGRARGREVAG